ncbi:hypothetical protein GMORB2_5343 [Geosmithia morbida]|uniref:EGF-like domain-containing protein n=1 Tax=Geosmithia morbida TaxID=1094350 RepID=A0A9P4YY73_9HYPO|nr:uncharacterized protein GMORB2_5343 [Geosmithia morbida]KAF4124677.1 hypothetical protein GMORB2_5343 [Geosmithia morbida]
MSRPNHGWDMDQPMPPAASMMRQRERDPGAYGPGAPRRQQYSPTMDSDASSSPIGNLSPPPRRHITSPPSSAQPPPPPMGAAMSSNSAAAPSSRSRFPFRSEGKMTPVISRPTHLSNWPLPSGSPAVPSPSGSTGAPSGRPLRAPPRPPRPSRVPSMVNQHRPEEPTPVFLTHQQHGRDGGAATEPELAAVTPMTPSSRLTTSSMGTIPEFPTPAAVAVPDMPPPPRRSLYLGPHAARRGVSSYYSTMSNVSPIAEENNRSHGSYASSAAMPGNWSPSSPLYSNPDSFFDDTMTDVSRDSMGDEYEDNSNLVRSASIGKKGRPQLVENKAGSSARPSPQPVQRPFQAGTGYVDETSSSSDTATPAVTPAVTPAADDRANQASRQFFVPVGLRGPTGSAADLEKQDLGPQRPSALPPARSNSRRLSGLKRPPRLDMDAVRAAEARGSLTSLPDLIKRATRLAAMIEGGRRPASRIDGLNDFPEKSDGNAKDDVAARRHHSGLSDMLNAFPSPAQAGPQERRRRGSWFPTTSWPLAPSRLRDIGEVDSSASPRPGQQAPRGDGAGSGEKKQKKRGCCCGLPKWAIALLVLLALCLLAAAIVLPLEAFVFKNLGGNDDEPESTTERCAASLTCKNGGTSYDSQGTCSCICTNGFTGRDCSVSGSEGCTTTDLVGTGPSSTISNVTLGTAIPRLVEDASANFSIPLSPSQILAKINYGDLSCRAQNSLVTFQGRSTRQGQSSDSSVSSLKTDDGGMASSKAMVQQRRADSGSDSDVDASGFFSASENVLDFARVAVLYVLQEEDETSASQAQAAMEQFFTRASRRRAKNRQAMNLTLSSGNTIDLLSLQINVGDGDVGGS